MTLLLAGDIGGTKTILRLVQAGSNRDCSSGSLDPLHEAHYSSRTFPDLVPMVQEFLSEASDQLGTPQQPEKACFAIAGPVVHNTSKLTNLGWKLEASRLVRELAIPFVHLINDFAAVGYGVLGLSDSDLHTLQPGELDATAPIAVIGAGTGLGQGFVIHSSEGYRIFSSEGGHADFAPRSELEFQLLLYLREKHNIGRISVERVVSGQGIISIYQFLRDRGFAQECEEVAEILREWDREIGQQAKKVDPAAAISQAAQAQRDRLSEQAMQMFIEAYGAEAGNLALKLLPYGGLYLAGGIAAKNLSLMQADSFISAFTEKGRVSHLLDRVPVHIILNPQVGLIGAAICAFNLVDGTEALPLVKSANTPK